MWPSLEYSIITIGARASPLSMIQVQEVLNEFRLHHPTIEFEILYVNTVGDRDRSTSLRSLDKTDFFTREIDQLLLDRKIRIGIHSAKDLPSPLPDRLKIICLTKGVDSSDSLVLRQGETLHSLRMGAYIATSSVRREEAVRLLRTDLTFKDIRGTIGERLEHLHNGSTDGVVIAEAALIRLGLTHLNRITLPGDTVEGQGRLAVVAHQDDMQMQQLFLPLHYITAEN